MQSYLDYNATAPVFPEVIEAMTAELQFLGNPSSIHGWGRQAKARLEAAREQVATLVNANPSEVFFTGGGTESNNLALNGSVKQGRRLLVSAIEHDSVLQVAKYQEEWASVLSVDRHGIIDTDALETQLEQCAESSLVSVMLANNETGVIQPLAEIVSAAKAYGALVHCDAVQGPGKIPIDFKGLGLDLMSISAHKFGGPLGVGALIVKEGVDLIAIGHGGSQERGLRPGTENIPAIVGFGTAARIASSQQKEIKKIRLLRDQIEKELGLVAPDVFIVSKEVERLPNTSAIIMPGVNSDIQLMALDLDGVAVSSGSACSSGKVSRSHVLEAMGLSNDFSGSAIRISLGWGSQQVDVENFLKSWGALYNRLGRGKA